MSCIGPGINEEQLERAYTEVITLLLDKYGIQKSEPYFLAERMLGMRIVLNKHLKQALRDLFYQQACEDF